MPDIATQRTLYALSKLPRLRWHTTSMELENRRAQSNAWEVANAIVAGGGGMAELLAADDSRIRLAALAEVEGMDRP